MAAHRNAPAGGHRRGDSASADETRSVDELYGLEPVIEPGGGDDACDHRERLQSRIVQCPYCGESFETVIDLSSGSTRYIEDCQVCCQPIEFSLEVEDEGTLAGLRVTRSD